MNTLILDCSCGMSVIVKTEKENFSKIDTNQKKHTDELLVAVDELLNESELKLNQLDNICVCVGPGSFTGIRVAISIVKGLSVANNFKIFELSNFEIYELLDKENSVLLLEGFSDFVYVRKYKNAEFLDGCFKILDAVTLINKENKNVYVQNEKLQNLLKKYEIDAKIAKNNLIFAFDTKIANNENIALEQISPIYLRGSQAEIEREKKLLEQKNV